MKKKMFKTTIFKKKRFWGVVIILVAITIVMWSLILMYSHTDEAGIITESEEIGWNTYLNEEFGFQIDFPEDWIVFEDFGEGISVINIYELEFGQIPPFDQFANVNNVSIFPMGTEAKLIIGETRESEIEISAVVDEAVEYYLESEETWATHVTFRKADESWKPWGFIWARAIVDDPDFSCRNGAAVIDIKECDPFGGDDFVRHGLIDLEAQEVMNKILESFRFIEER